jgi:hypothetical protein
MARAILSGAGLGPAGMAILVSAALAGCGSTSHTPASHRSDAGAGSVTARAPAACSVSVNPCITDDPAVRAVGSPSLPTNLLQALAHNQKELSNVTLRCPSSHAYPVRCHLRATETVAGGQPRRRMIAGTLTVLGVATLTHTYAYTLSYAPVSAPS